MSTGQTFQIESTSLEQTLALGESLGRSLRGGELIELISDLGGGKTSFVRGIAKGMGSVDNVHSPSFTISNQYEANDLTLYHFDFYRLIEAGIMKDELAEILSDPQAVVAVEWGEIVEDIMPSSKLIINIQSTSENDRTFSFTYPEELSYLVPRNI